MADGNGNKYKILQPTINKYKKAKQNINEVKAYYEKIEEKKKIFYNLFESHHGSYAKFMMMGMLCLAVIVFDFFVSSHTMSSIPILGESTVGLIFAALIFSFIDGTVAVFISGLFAKSQLELITEMRKWRLVLWGLASIKIILFIVFSHIVVADGSDNGFSTWLMTFLIVCLILLIYYILEKAGKGLFYIIRSLTLWLNEEVLNQPPSAIQKICDNLLSDINLKISQFGFNQQEVYNLYNLP